MPQLKTLLTLTVFAQLAACSSTSTLRLCNDRLQPINMPTTAAVLHDTQGRATP
jgi:hypothetical protein